MKLTRVQGFAAACCLAAPLMLGAQATPADGGNTPSGNPASANPTSPLGQPGAPSSTSTQMTPGVNRPNPTGTGTAMASEGAPMGGASEDASEHDKKFLKAASEGGMAEIQLGQLASSKASNPKVKAFGQRMVTDHTMLNNELKPFADKAGVQPPTTLKAEDQAEYDKLNGLSGADFDKEYVSFMMKDHQQDLKDFKEELATTSDPQLKAAVRKGERVIEEHHTAIDKIGTSMGVSGSGM